MADHLRHVLQWILGPAWQGTIAVTAAQELRAFILVEAGIRTLAHPDLSLRFGSESLCHGAPHWRTGARLGHRRTALGSKSYLQSPDLPRPAQAAPTGPAEWKVAQPGWALPCASVESSRPSSGKITHRANNAAFFNERVFIVRLCRLCLGRETWNANERHTASRSPVQRAVVDHRLDSEPPL